MGVRSGSEILAKARDLVRSGWCRGADARDRSGAPVDAWSPGARSWSILGAVVAAADLPSDLGGARLGPLRQALGALAEVIEEPVLMSWNDDPDMTQAEVVQTLEDARRICAARHP